MWCFNMFENYAGNRVWRVVLRFIMAFSRNALARSEITEDYYTKYRRTGYEMLKERYQNAQPQKRI